MATTELNATMHQILAATTDIPSEQLKSLLETAGANDNAPTLDEILVEESILDRPAAEKLKAAAKSVMDAPGIPGYTMVNKLGQGGMGAVYRARQRSMDRDVAIKILPAHLAKNQAFVDRFYREARASARLDHPNVVRGYDVGEANGIHYFVMEFVDGQSAQKILDQRGRLDLGDALKIVRDIALALIAAQEHNMVHRDIKPDNIMITNKGVVKLADLGLAKQMDDDSGLTQTGSGFGTPYYMAPEQARNAKYADGRSDIYALGVTLYHLVTGSLPFKGETAMEVLLSKETGKYTPPSRIAGSIRPAVDLLIDKMMVVDPKFRFQTAAETIAAIDKLSLTNASLSFVAAEAPISATPPTPSKLQATRAAGLSDPGPKGKSAKVIEKDVWYLRYISKGQAHKTKADTPKVIALIKAGKYDGSVEASRDPDGPFKRLGSYREFDGAFAANRAQRKVDKKSEDVGNKLSKLVSNIDAVEARYKRNKKLKEMWFKISTVAVMIMALGGGGYLIWSYVQKQQSSSASQPAAGVDQVVPGGDPTR